VRISWVTGIMCASLWGMGMGEFEEPGLVKAAAPFRGTDRRDRDQGAGSALVSAARAALPRQAAKRSSSGKS